ncbi:hypothetical protein J6590_017139 [Homalodisca vitripennis]|nr:hypothetical protein J6590_017139 [Homalodisca vitripennis]
MKIIKSGIKLSRAVKIPPNWLKKITHLFIGNFQNPSSSASTSSSSRLRTVRAKSGSLSFISSKYESLDYDTCENKLLVDEERTRGYPYVIQTDVARWFLFFLIGLFTAAIGVFVDIAIAHIADIKYSILKHSMDQCIKDCFYKTYLIWLGLVMGPVLVASVLVVYIEGYCDVDDTDADPDCILPSDNEELLDSEGDVAQISLPSISTGRPRGGLPVLGKSS